MMARADLATQLQKRKCRRLERRHFRDTGFPQRKELTATLEALKPEFHEAGT
jgi:hypothetical protein